ncbi:MAG: glycosyltransferase family 39 protein, partial [Bacteroidales bacterium]
MFSSSGKNIPWIPILWLLLILGTIGFISLLASVPPVSRDALTHHLAVPKLYLEHGGIYEIPHLRFSYYPMNIDLLYLIPLYFGNDIIPKFIHFAFAIITAGMIYKYLSRRINTSYALPGALFFLTIPVIVRLSATVYVDLGLICFLFASLLYLFRWTESDFKPKYLLISAVFSGLALGTKYNGLVGLFLLGMFCAFVYARHRAGGRLYGAKAIGWCAVFVTVALIIFSPWMIKNFAWTGNPVYPLYNSVFNAEKIEESTKQDQEEKKRTGMTHIQVRRHVYGESWAEIALIPVRVFFQGQDDNPKYFDGKTSPFLLFLPLFAFLGISKQSRQQRTEKYIMLFFSVLFLLYACAQTSVRIRYFSPILPSLVILSMFGLYNLQTGILHRTRIISEPMKKMVIFCIILAMLALNAFYMADRFKKDQPLAYLTGKVTRDEYIRAYRPEYASYKYANQNLSQNDKIFGLYIGNRGYYSDIPVEF